MVFSTPGLKWASPSDHVELFAGCMSVTKGEWEAPQKARVCDASQAGRSAVPMDLLLGDGDSMNLASDVGFANALYHVLNLKEPRSRGSTMRSRTQPMGDTSRPSVQLGNLLTARTVVLLILAAAKGCWWVCEQPSSSLMERHVLFQRMLHLVAVRKLRIRMSSYGAPTHKPTILYSSPLLSNCFLVQCKVFMIHALTLQSTPGHQAIDSLAELATTPTLATKNMVRHYTDKAGRSRITGSSDLKKSQAYPRQCLGLESFKCSIDLA